MDVNRFYGWALSFGLALLSFAAHSDDEFGHRPADFVLALEQYLVEEVMPHIPGAAIAIIADGEIELLQGYGVLRQGENTPVQADTVFRLASVSKTIAATAAAKLVRDEALEWQTPISLHLTDLQFRNADYGQRITLQNILSHTTGLMPQAYTNLIEARVPYQRVIERIGEVDFICPPENCYSYQNVVFSLVGDLIEIVTGLSYEQYVEQHLFQSLGMNWASFGMDNLLANPNHAHPHVRRRGQWIPVPVSDEYYAIAPAAGANASVRDMAFWLQAQLGAREDVLPLPLLDQLHRPIVATSNRQAHYRFHPQLHNIHYALGWRMFDFAEHKNFIHHGGWVRGIRTELLFNRELQLGLVFLSNSENRYAREVVYRFLELYTEYHQQTVTFPLTDVVH
ncbi:serine hydrolase [Marinimicrobium sp. ABcell2]|uniref:serine hydrolase domain-containing protein n=1 Tax=Marinimicrobium sp. ABcell2 TaxID=3069751 RepID=UPI0027B2455B|nr:serine hydrolase [Marinimicrobium sp. ABcell2]MDQ2076943.1 serine hydrolase [Marinimicrobium sp. ABcell2]